MMDKIKKSDFSTASCKAAFSGEGFPIIVMLIDKLNEAAIYCAQLDQLLTGIKDRISTLEAGAKDLKSVQDKQAAAIAALSNRNQTT